MKWLSFSFICYSEKMISSMKTIWCHLPCMSWACCTSRKATSAQPSRWLKMQSKSKYLLLTFGVFHKKHYEIISCYIMIHSCKWCINWCVFMYNSTLDSCWESWKNKVFALHCLLQQNVFLIVFFGVWFSSSAEPCRKCFIANESSQRKKMEMHNLF